MYLTCVVNNRGLVVCPASVSFSDKAFSIFILFANGLLAVMVAILRRHNKILP